MMKEAAAGAGADTDGGGCGGGMDDGTAWRQGQPCRPQVGEDDVVVVVEEEETSGAATMTTTAVVAAGAGAAAGAAIGRTVRDPFVEKEDWGMGGKVGGWKVEREKEDDEEGHEVRGIKKAEGVQGGRGEEKGGCK